MDISLARVLICLVAGIAVIVLLTAKWRVHAFFALAIACFLVGLGVGMPLANVLTSVKDGFGNILKSLGFIIVLGTTLGVILEHSGATRVMANAILKRVGEKRSALAMSLTGFIVGLPIFCDSGYIVLSGLNKSLSRTTGISLVIMAVSLATGLYAVHCLIPPHPGAAAAAGIIGVDYGKLILTGIGVAIPAMAVGYLWANYAGKKVPIVIADNEQIIVESTQHPSTLKSVFIGAGGAFGAVLAATKIGNHLSDALPLASMGIFFPFLITFVLKTAQGSSTVAIITAASIVLPLLPSLDLDNEKGHLLCVLAMGAGSMMISHANDAYFWVIAKFSGLEMNTMLKVYSVATICMGVTSFIIVYLLSFIL
jgi:H+/gluconate symporter-like permease